MLRPSEPPPRSERHTDAFGGPCTHSLSLRSEETTERGARGIPKELMSHFGPKEGPVGCDGRLSKETQALLAGVTSLSRFFT